MKSSVLQAYLLDDEPDSLRVLGGMINDHCDGMVEIIGESNDPRSALPEMQTLKPDLLFLDIDMPFMNGFDFLQKLPAGDCEVVFTTAYDKYALQAFRTSAVEYLLKPVKAPELISAVQKVQLNRATQQSLQAIPFLLQQIKDIESDNIRKVALPTAEGISFLNIDQIVYCESDDTYTTLCMTDGSRLLLAKTLRNIETILGEFNFIRVHRSYLVNMQLITNFNRADGGTIMMTNGKMIPLARSRRSYFTEFVKTRFPNLLG